MHGYTKSWDDLNENCNCIDSKLLLIVMHGYKKLDGGDLNENDSFNNRKLVMHGYKIMRSQRK